MMTRRFDDTVFGSLVKAWPILVLIGSMLIYFGVFKAKLTLADEEFKINRVEHQKLNERLAQVESAVAQLPEMRQDIKSILREMKK